MRDRRGPGAADSRAAFLALRRLVGRMLPLEEKQGERKQAGQQHNGRPAQSRPIADRRIALVDLGPRVGPCTPSTGGGVVQGLAIGPWVGPGAAPDQLVGTARDNLQGRRKEIVQVELETNTENKIDGRTRGKIEPPPAGRLVDPGGEAGEPEEQDQAPG